jgi:hypothetical protein
MNDVWPERQHACMPNRRPYPTDVSDEELGLRRPLPRPGPPRRTPAHPRPARGLRRLAVDREGRRPLWRMLCPTTSRPGRPSTSRRSGGVGRRGLRDDGPRPARAVLWLWPSAASRSPRRRTSTAARCAPPPRAVRAGATTGPKTQEGLQGPRGGGHHGSCPQSLQYLSGASAMSLHPPYPALLQVVL